MKHIAYLSFKVLVALALTVPVLAGGDHKCSQDAQACINKITEKASTKGWLGVELDYSDKGLVIKKVVENSPAAAVDLRPGEHLVALNGVPYSQEKSEAMANALKHVTPGNTVTYTVANAGKERQVKVTLGKMPAEVVAKWLGNHMMKFHSDVEYVN